MIHMGRTEEPRMRDELGPPGHEDLRRERRHRLRGRRLILRSTAVLPATFTLLNALSGFASIHFATKDALGQATLWNLAAASWFIFGAMAFDMLDGRLARMTRRTSDFGGQLDSLADVISFGLAPAILMLRTVVMILRGPLQLPGYPAVERVVWGFAAVYMACAALRLARFNVENEPDESAHLVFKGLPSPGAAAAVAGLVLLFAELEPIHEGWKSSPWLLGAVSFTLPVVTLLAGLLMVSSFPYLHLMNQYVRAKRPFGYIVRLAVLAVAGAVVGVYITLAVVTLAYALSGPVRHFWRRLHRRGHHLAPPVPPAAPV
jgi:CDP-diacylglycerol--serine O-phosphatidyltransferase